MVNRELNIWSRKNDNSSNQIAVLGPRYITRGIYLGLGGQHHQTTNINWENDLSIHAQTAIATRAHNNIVHYKKVSAIGSVHLIEVPEIVPYYVFSVDITLAVTIVLKGSNAIAFL